MVLTRSKRRTPIYQSFEQLFKTSKLRDDHASKGLQERLTIKLHFGGVVNSEMEYIEGNVHQWEKVDPDYISLYKLILMLKEVGVKYNSKHAFYYLVPGLDLTNGLTKVYYDAEVLEMCSVGSKNGMVEVFCFGGDDEKGDTGCFSNNGCKSVIDVEELESSSDDSDSMEDNDDSCDENYLPEKEILDSSSDEELPYVGEKSKHVKKGLETNQSNEGTSKLSRPCENMNVPLPRGWESEKGHNALGSDMETGDTVEIIERYVDKMENICAQGDIMYLEGQNALEGSDMETDDTIGIIERYVDKMENSCAQGDIMHLKGQNALERSDMEMDDATEVIEGYSDNTDIICAQRGTIQDMEEECDGSCAATVPLSPVWESEKGDNALEGSVMEMDGTEESDGGCASSNVYVGDNEEKTDKEKPSEDEVLMKFTLDNSDACIVNERKSSEATTEGLPASNDCLASLDLGIVENMTKIVEHPEDPSKVNAEEPIETLLNKGEEEHVKENASITNEVKEVTGQNAFRIQDAVSHEETPLPSVEKNPIVEACNVDINEDVDYEKKTLNVNNALDEADTTEHLNDEEKLEVNPTVEVNLEGNRSEKLMASQGHSGSVTAKDDRRLSPGDDAAGSKDHVEITESYVKIERVGNSTDCMSLSNKSEKQKMENKGSVESVMEDIKNPEPSKKSKLSKRLDSMGMIFICTSETKKDCYQYRVLGAPASKYHMVSKIYKGMRIFLFDIELRMMYGTFKAAGPGGYNIKPRAFKSKFPSQVRFSILEDCVPLAEERFKKILKDNYYTEHKFNCQLNHMQVKNLCKLFHEASMQLEYAKVIANNKQVAATTSSAWLHRAWVEGSQRGATTSLEGERTQIGVQEDIRHTPVVTDDRYHGCPACKRETYVPMAPTIIYQPLIVFCPHSRTYTYDRPNRGVWSL